MHDSETDTPLTQKELLADIQWHQSMLSALEAKKEDDSFGEWEWETLCWHEDQLKKLREESLKRAQRKPMFHWTIEILEFERFEAKVRGHSDVVADIDAALALIDREK